jgi:hypothetical protein
MRTILVSVWVSLGVLLGVACDGPGNTNDACTAAGGACQSENLACNDTFPYPCASPSNVCCRPSSKPLPAAAPTSTGSTQDAAAE